MITRSVNVKAEDDKGHIYSRAIITAILSGPDNDPTYGYIDAAESQVTVRADDLGDAVLNLWPNSRGDNDTKYRIVASSVEGRVIFDVWAKIPDQDGSILNEISSPASSIMGMAENKPKSGSYTLISEHIQDKTNPHDVTAVQVGAEEAGAVDAHNALENPHNITAAMIGAEEAGAVASALAGVNNMVIKDINAAGVYPLIPSDSGKLLRVLNTVTITNSNNVDLTSFNCLVSQAHAGHVNFDTTDFECHYNASLIRMDGQGSTVEVIPSALGVKLKVIGELEGEVSWDAKVDKVAGKGLSTEDYTTAEKNKLASLSDSNPISLAINSVDINTATYTLSDSDLGKNLVVSVDCNIIVPQNLMSGFNCLITKDAVAHVYFTWPTPVTLDNSQGHNAVSDVSDVCAIIPTGTADKYKLVGRTKLYEA